MQVILHKSVRKILNTSTITPFQISWHGSAAIYVKSSSKSIQKICKLLIGNENYCTTATVASHREMDQNHS